MKLLSSYAIRRCLIADPGYAILTADFDQIELRIAAGLAGEQSLIEAAKRGESLHKIAAVKLFGPDYTPDQYRYTKNVNFGWLYGGGPKTLSEQAGIPLTAAGQIIGQYQEEFPALTGYKRRQQDQVLRQALTSQEYKVYRGLQSRMYAFRGDTPQGRKQRWAVQMEIERLMWRKLGAVTTPYGRRILVDAAKAYKATNYIVQSTARDIMAEALLDVMDDPELEPTVLLPIHDEILGQAPIAAAKYFAGRYGEVMTREFRGVPLDASGKVYGKSWGHGYRSERQPAPVK
jgi:DNA polymerase-1